MSSDQPMIEAPRDIREEKISIKSDIGLRRANEDTHIACSLGEGVKIFGVFDGHGGRRVSSLLLQLPTFLYLLLLKERKDIREVLEYAIHDMDTFVFGKGIRGGSTISLVLKWEDTLYFVNLGDSRSILVDRKTREVLHSTVDHKPEFEKARIEKAGGKVYGIPARIDGVISVSRALGDNEFKRGVDGKYRGCFSKISPKPDITTYTLKGGERLIIACDGVWDGLTNKDVSQLDTSEEIIRKAYSSRGYTGDNLTVIVYDF